MWSLAPVIGLAAMLLAVQASARAEVLGEAQVARPTPGIEPPPRAVNPAIAVDDAVKRLQTTKPDNSAKLREREFFSRITAFAKSWNKLIRGAEKGLWDAEEALKARKAFERLVRSEGWIEHGKTDAVSE